jgi:hypothetical protein
MQTIAAYQTLIWALLIGVGIFAIFMLLMVVFFGVATATFGKNKPGLVALFLFSLLTPLFIMNTQQRTQPAINAQKDITIIKVRIVSIDTNTYELRFETDQAAIGTLELVKDGVTTSILPAYSLQPRTQHFIQVEKTKYDGAEILILLDGKKYPFKVERSYN